MITRSPCGPTTPGEGFAVGEPLQPQSMPLAAPNPTRADHCRNPRLSSCRPPLFTLMVRILLCMVLDCPEIGASTSPDWKVTHYLIKIQTVLSYTVY